MKRLSTPQSRLLGCVLLALGIATNARTQEPKPSEFQFGLIADCQYCSDPGSGVRKYALSEEKLTRCVAHLNTLELDFVAHLGDFIDRDFESFDVVAPIYERLNAPRYHVLGNHDFSVEDTKKSAVPQRLGLESRYYDFENKDWRFIVLDGNDISFHAYPEGSDEQAFAHQYYNDNEIQAPKWNGAIGAEQQAWLRNVLRSASAKGQNAVLFCHFPVYPENAHNLWNANEIIALLEEYPCVKAYINGHNHAGNYEAKHGIHYLTLKGMVDSAETSYAVIQTAEDQLIINGFGRENDRVLK